MSSSGEYPKTFFARALQSTIRPDSSTEMINVAALSKIERYFSSFFRSAFYIRLRSVISRKVTTAPTILPSSMMGVLVYSTGKLVPSLRQNTSSSTFR